MSDKEIDVSRAKNGKVKLMVDSNIDVELIHLSGNPPGATALPGKTITWLAYFDVKKKDKKNANDKVKYKIKLTGSDNFVFWDGVKIQRNLNWKNKISFELSGDPAIGMER
jgi:hypothetical protein